MHKWITYDIIDPDHRADLERLSAVFEQQHGLARPIAESYAYSKYKRTQHAKAAGHHLVGMINAKAAGNVKDSQKHYAMYSLHLEEMGLNPVSAVSPEIAAQKPDKWLHQGYAAHKADDYLKI